MTISPNNTTLSQTLYTQGTGTTSSNPFVTVYSNRDPNSTDINYPIQKRWVNFALVKEWILENFISTSGTTVANWVLLTNGSGLANIVSFTNNQTGNVATPVLGNIIISAPSSQIVVDTSGNTISLSLAGGSAAIERVNVQTGTTPIVPLAGAITINGARVAAGTNPVRSDGTGANTLAIEVQTSQAIASTNATNVGLAAFNSADFTVDANGFVSLAGTGTAAVQTLTGNTGGAISPVAGNINTVGTGSITTTGAGNTLTTQLTGLTLNAIQVGAGNATLTQLGPTNNSVLTTSATGVPTLTPLAVNGQLIIGSSSGAPSAATLTPGTGITITNGANSITIAATGGSFVWVDVTTATQTMAIQTGYVTDHVNVTYTLPSTAALGDQVRVVGKLGITTIAQNAGQQILMSSASSTVGVTGSIVGTNVGDCVWLVCITAGASTVWRGESFVGNWTVN